MKIIHAYFKGYAGFYHGMGLEELDIDLSKCKHNIVLIVGKNGCGKSTLEGALNIFPDSSSCFRDGIDAEKRLRILDGDNIYDISIQYPIDSNGNRKTTKAFIARNGEELNPNGNVTSYKDLLGTEFDLDPNFVALSMLTSTDRGLGDKRPAERKKFVGSVIDNLTTYNNIYKTLNKKSLIYKSHINTIYTKIQSTGDKQALDSNLSQLRVQEKNLNDRILEANNNIVAIQAKNSLDEDEVKSIEELNNKLNELNNTKDTISASLGSYTNQTKISMDDISETLSSNQQLLASYNTEHDALSLEWKAKNDRLSQVSSSIHQMEVTLTEANSNIDDSLEEKYRESNNTISRLNKEISDLGIPVDTNLIGELSDIINFYKEFIVKLDSFYDGMNLEDVSAVTVNYNPNILSILQGHSESIIKKTEQVKRELEDNTKALAVIDKRPKSCKEDNCPFIKDALSIAGKFNKKQLADKISGLEEQIVQLSGNLTEIQEKTLYWNSMISKRAEFGVIRSMFENIKARYPKSTILSKAFNDLDSRVASLYQFNEARNPDNLIIGLNLLNELEEEIKFNQIIEVSYQAHREKIKIINSTTKTLASLKEEQDDLHKSIADLRKKLDTSESLIDNLSSNIGIQTLYKTEYDKYIQVEKDISDIMSKLEVYQKKSSKAVESLAVIQQFQDTINKANEELVPVKSSIADIAGRLTLLDSYYQEYNMYNDSYNIIETLKKYCSPTGGGIQTIFMQIYMSKTLQLSNQILGMLFGGEYQLIDFIINENEFRIPFIGNGLQVDDISSGSNSQICMMGMVINLVLLHQASTKYNIAYLDEIDAGLDHRNRFEFVDALYKSIPLLQIEQLFMISHSMETDTSSVDIIKLKGYDDFEDMVQGGNVIFNYSQSR